jgi:hypothetical protein
MKDTQKMISRELKQKEDEVLQSRETIRIMGLDAARREKDLKASSANTVRELKTQRDLAYEAHRLTSSDRDTALQLNTEVAKQQKNIEDCVALRKELNHTQRERDLARKDVRALTDEQWSWSALLVEADDLKLEETTSIQSSNEVEIENIRKEHDLELSATDQAWEVALEHQVNLAKSSSLKETKKIKEELDLERSQSQDYKMRLWQT